MLRSASADARLEARGQQSLGHAEALDLPFKLDAAICLHTCAHRLAELFDVGAGGVALIDEEVAVHLGDMRAANDKASAAGAVDELPGLIANRVLEGRAA